MTTTQHHTTSRLRNRAARLILAAVVATAASLTHAAAVLSPTLPGEYAAGTGANATFHRIDGNWAGTSVYWKEPPDEQSTGQYSNTPGDGFYRIGAYGWKNGGGIWGLVDWASINADGSTLPVRSWSERVATIDQADAEYPAAGYSDSWGAVGALPPELFAGTTGPQDNWTSRYTGYLRITDPGLYNFGVLYDDGFFLKIWGAGGSMVEIWSDFLSPRDRLGFSEDLLLNTGLYRFELGAYDRLEVGVVNLAWSKGGGKSWTTVPTEHLVIEPIPIPTPGTVALLLAAIGALALARMKRKRG